MKTIDQKSFSNQDKKNKPRQKRVMRARTIDRAVLEQTREEYVLDDLDPEYDVAMDSDEQENMINAFKENMIRNNEKYVKILQIIVVLYCLCILLVIPGKTSNKRYKTISIQSSALTLLYTSKKFTTKKQSTVFIIVNVLLVLFLVLRSFLASKNWQERIVVQCTFALPPTFFLIVSQLFSYWSNDLEASLNQLMKRKYKFKSQ